MDQKVYDTYVSILKSELVPALGCTEPIAIAYASAKARDVLGEMPERLELWCSGNIIKNVKGVVVPNSGGLHGIDVAGILGLVGGNPNKCSNRSHRRISTVQQSFCRRISARVI